MNSVLYRNQRPVEEAGGLPGFRPPRYLTIHGRHYDGGCVVWSQPNRTRKSLTLRLALAIAAPLALTACGSVKPASTAGECRILREPGFVVQGARVQDRRWIAQTVESATAVCGWSRPKA